nr:DUF3887 domain-containing protein [uncultured Sellimonas sp.]
MKKRKRIICVMMTIIALMLLTTGCASKLSEKFDEGEVQKKAEEIAELSCTGEISKAYGMLSEMMKAQITEEQIRAGIEGTIEPLGDFEKISGTNVSGQKDKDTGTEYALAIVMAQFSDGKAQFTISFDTEMNCIGFYIK